YPYNIFEGPAKSSVGGIMTRDGISGRAESLVPIMLSEGVNKGRISLKRFVEVMSENPARLFGLYPKKGVIAIGSDADFTIVDLNKTKKVTRDQLYTINAWSFWEGWKITGWPVMTIIRGNVMMEWLEGEPRPKIVGEPMGKYLPRKLG
ncbi:amidohydrolase family protein, partial [Chloroflexota bacterium]